MTRAELFLINTELFNRRAVTTGKSSFNSTPLDRFNLMPVQLEQFTRFFYAARGLYNPDGKGLKQQRKATVLSGPWCRDGFNTVLFTLDPWKLGVQIG
jgi:hypothetical protein